jgi:hypothetical protein
MGAQRSDKRKIPVPRGHRSCQRHSAGTSVEAPKHPQTQGLGPGGGGGQKPRLRRSVAATRNKIEDCAMSRWPRWGGQRGACKSVRRAVVMPSRGFWVSIWDAEATHFVRWRSLSERRALHWLARKHHGRRPPSTTSPCSLFCRFGSNGRSCSHCEFS